MSTDIPKLDLSTFFLSISSAALRGLGVIPGDEEKTGAVDLVLAKQNIDLLELMSEKTQGNRSGDEDKLLEQLLFETRMCFVEAQKRAGSKENAQE